MKIRKKSISELERFRVMLSTRKKTEAQPPGGGGAHQKMLDAKKTNTLMLHPLSSKLIKMEEMVYLKLKEENPGAVGKRRSRLC